MSFLDKFLNVVRLNDDYDDDDEFYDEEEEYEEEEEIVEAPKQKSRFMKKMKKEEEYDDEIEEIPVQREKKSRNSSKNKQKSKVTQINQKSRPAREVNDMEVAVIKPVSMENTREIADNLLTESTVVLNLEGVDVDLAQRIIDFSCGACYALNGSLQKISGYIFILTPEAVEISGDITDVLNGGIPSMRNDY